MNRNPSIGHGRGLTLYLTGDHACSYLDAVQARTLFVDPAARIDGPTYQALIEQGFRRSGVHVYRPACRACARCIPVRVPVDCFERDRSQRRNWRRNAADLTLSHAFPRFETEHFALYRRYLESRHPDGSMSEESNEDSYRRFLCDDWGGETRFLEFREGHRLVAVAVTDILENSLSAVYTFFDPALAHRGPGVFAVLAQVELARKLRLPHVYLGYWIEESRKMSYKTAFRPIEAWDGRRWRLFERGAALELP